LLSAKQIAPGQSGEIEVSLKTEGAAGSTLHKSVVVTCNDPRQPTISLSLEATVEAEFQTSERSLYFGSVPKGKEALQELIITIPDDKAVKLLSADSTDQSIAVKLEAIPGTNDKKFKVVATLKADAKDGYHFGSIIIKTTSKTTPELKVPIRGMVVANPGA
jgi:hypothetical protein